ncbi:MAG: hypothetical protein ACK5AZ_01975 [Bryobacteraceae bacterium]
MARKRKRYDAKKEVRRIARERVGPVKPSRPIEPQSRKKPKHKRPPGEVDENASE